MIARISTMTDRRLMRQNRNIGMLKRRWPKTLDHYIQWLKPMKR